MHVVYAFENVPENCNRSLFLAGPTPRDLHTPSWRPEALKVLKSKNYDGVIFVPEARDGEWRDNYEGQIEWEENGLKISDVILFWVPRKLPEMPGFTTNIEFGKWNESGKCVLGFPERTPNTGYMAYYAKKFAIPIAHDLSGTIQEAIALGEKLASLRRANLT